MARKIAPSAYLTYHQEIGNQQNQVQQTNRHRRTDRNSVHRATEKKTKIIKKKKIET